MPLSRKRRLLRFLTRTTLVLGACAVGLYLLRVPLFGGLLRDRLEQAAYEETGAQVSIGSVRGSWISDVTLADIKVLSVPEGSPIERASVVGATIEYRLLDLLDDPAQAIDYVGVSGLDVALQLVESDSAIEPDELEQPLADFLKSIPDTLPRARVEGRIRVATDQASLQTLVVAEHSRRGEFDFDFVDIDVAVGRRTFRQTSLRLELRRDADSLSIGNVITLGGVELREARAALTEDGPRLSAIARVGGEIAIVVDRRALHAELRGVELAEIPDIARTLLGDDDAEIPPLTVDGNVTLGWHGPLDLEADDVTLALDDATLHVAALRVGDIDDPGTASLTALALSVSDVAQLASRLGVEIPPERLPTGGPVTVELRVPRASLAAAEIERLDVRSPRSSLDAAGTLDIPRELLDDTAAWREVGMDVRAAVQIDAAELAATAPSEWNLQDASGRLECAGTLTGKAGEPAATGRVEARDAVLDGKRVESLVVEAELRGNALRIDELVAISDLGRLTASGTALLGERTVRDAAFEIDVPDLAPIGELRDDIPPLAGSLHARGALDGPLKIDVDAWSEAGPDTWPSDVSLRAEADGEGITVDGSAFGDLTASLVVDGPRVEIERLRVDGALGRVAATGWANVTDGSVQVPGFAIEAPDLAALARWLPTLEDTHGAIEADGSLRRDPGEAWEDAKIGIALRAPRLSVPGAELSGVTVRLHADDGDMQLHEVAAGTPWGSLAGEGHVTYRDDVLTCVLDRLDAELDPTALGFESDPLPLSLRRPVTFAWQPDRAALTGLDADFLGGRIRADVSRGRDATLSASGEGLDLSLLTTDAEGRLSGTLELSGSPDRPDALLHAEVPELTWQGEAGRLDIDIRQDADGLHVARCDVAAGKLLQLSANGYAPLVIGESGVRRQEGRRATMHLEARSESPTSWLARFAPVGSRATHASLVADAAGPSLEAELVVRDLEWDDAEDGFPAARLDGETRVAVTASPEGSTAEIASGDGGPFAVSGELRVGGPIDWRDPVGSAKALPEASLAGNARISVPDITDVASWFSLVHSVDGALDLDIHAAGTVGSPKVHGVIEAHDISVLAVDDIPPIDRGHLRARIEGRTATLEECTLRLGYAPLTLTGSVTHESGGEPVLDIHAVGENVQLVRTLYTRVRADVDVTAKGPLSGFELAGTARVTDAWYTKPVETTNADGTAQDTGFQLFRILDEPLASMRFDVDVQADRTVYVENNVAFGVLSLDMQLGGTGAVPEPRGTLSGNDIVIRLPVTRMTVEAVTLTFPPERPFDPNVRISAFARVKGYDLDVQVTGALSDNRVLIASSPALSQEDSLILLATGAAPASETTGGQVGASAAAGAGTLLGEAAMDWFTGPRKAGEDRIADRIEVYVGRETSETGLATVEAEVELTDGWFLRFERDRWEDYAAGVLWRVRFK